MSPFRWPSENQHFNKTKQNKKKKIQKPDEFKNQMNIDAHSSHTWIIRKTQCEDILIRKGQCLHAAMTVVIQNFQRLLYICIKQEQGYLMKIRNWTDHSYRVHRWTVQSRGGMWDTERTNCGRPYGLLYQDPRTLCYESTIQYMARLTLVLYHD